jgi:hypothetical protein
MRQRLLARKQNTVMRHIGLESRVQLASLAKFSTAKEAAVQDGFFFSFSEVLGASTWYTKV